ncbi:MAG: sugar transferase [Oscillospiraceae bacterium]|nr:sugar transferase [Oscillospiraceae bacterium]
MNRHMKNEIIMRILKCMSLLGNTALFMAYFFITSPSLWHISRHLTPYCTFTVLFLFLFMWLVRVYNSFEVGGRRVYELVYSLTLSSVIASAIMYVVQAAFLHSIPNFLLLMVLFIVEFICNTLWVYIANKIYYKLYKAKKTVIIYRSESDLNKLSEIKFFFEKFDVIKYIEDPNDIHSLIEEIGSCEAVFTAGIDATLRNGIVKYCVENSIAAYIEPKIGDIIMAGAKHMQMFSVPIMCVNRAAPDPFYLAVKRSADIIMSLIGIVVTSPVMLATAIAVKAYDGGPAIYKQIRVTKDGKKFNILKFRSMRTDAEKDGIARLSTENDDRITPVGKIIRACRIDELPQLFCILKGTMSIVGPRPERPEIIERYEKTLPSFSLRLQVKAGLTGYAQVYGRYNTEPYDKLQMDLMYINNMSLSFDIGLIFATVKVLFMPDSTAGVKEGQITSNKSTAEPVKELAVSNEKNGQ